MTLKNAMEKCSKALDTIELCLFGYNYDGAYFWLSCYWACLGFLILNGTGTGGLDVHWEFLRMNGLKSILSTIQIHILHLVFFGPAITLLALMILTGILSIIRVFFRWTWGKEIRWRGTLKASLVAVVVSSILVTVSYFLDSDPPPKLYLILCSIILLLSTIYLILSVTFVMNKLILKPFVTWVNNFIKALRNFVLYWSNHEVPPNNEKKEATQKRAFRSKSSHIQE